MDFQTKAIELVTLYGSKLVLALVVWVIGLIIIKHMTAMLHKIFEKTEFDQALETFMESLFGVVLKVLLVIIAVSILGVETTSLVALLGAAGVAVGLALQGSLANFAGGALILFFKPFSVGDKIQVVGHTGIVEEIQIFSTILRTSDHKKIIIPNAQISNEPLVNLTGNKKVGVELTFGIGYTDDIDKAKEILFDIISNHPNTHESPEPLVGVVELADSSVNILTRSFTDADSYWTVLFDLQEQVKKAFDKDAISIPFPQQDVHMYNHN